jgi:hypothetical protein
MGWLIIIGTIVGVAGYFTQRYIRSAFHHPTYRDSPWICIALAFSTIGGRPES